MENNLPLFVSFLLLISCQFGLETQAFHMARVSPKAPPARARRSVNKVSTGSALKN